MGKKSLILGAILIVIFSAGSVIYIKQMGVAIGGPVSIYEMDKSYCFIIEYPVSVSKELFRTSQSGNLDSEKLSISDNDAKNILSDLVERNSSFLELSKGNYRIAKMANGVIEEIIFISLPIGSTIIRLDVHGELRYYNASQSGIEIMEKLIQKATHTRSVTW